VSGAYRDYHGRTLHDLRPWNIDGEPYVHADAIELARTHARDFVGKVAQRLDAFGGGEEGLVCCALDTELLGHWWYEGPTWLAAVVEEAAAQGVVLRTVSDAVARTEPVVRDLAQSSWGTPKDLRTWDSPKVAELAFIQRRAELRLVAAATTFRTDETRLARAARELLALQSSDWAFQITRELAADYPQARTREHVATLEAALTDSSAVPDPRLRNLQPELDLSPLLSP
jgi:1,4-alpha-glucan branching enzyme